MNNTEPMRIAPSRHGKHWNVEHWKAIDFSSDDGWEKAIDIFEDRYRNRFLSVIEQIEDKEGAGFAVMALDCLLIETLQQFYEGVEETPRKKVKEYFVTFLTKTSTYFSQFFNEPKAKKFYRTIRNGILHQAEIKASSRIWFREGEPLVQESKDSKGLVIHRKKFHTLLVQEFDNYIERLRQNNPPDNDLRKKFKKKMDAICSKG